MVDGYFGWNVPLIQCNKLLLYWQYLTPPVLEVEGVLVLVPFSCALALALVNLWPLSAVKHQTETQRKPGSKMNTRFLQLQLAIMRHSRTIVNSAGKVSNRE